MPTEKLKLYYVDTANSIDDGNAVGGSVQFTLEEAATEAEEMVLSNEESFTVYELVPVMVVELGKPVRRMITE